MPIAHTCKLDMPSKGIAYACELDMPSQLLCAACPPACDRQGFQELERSALSVWRGAGGPAAHKFRQHCHRCSGWHGHPPGCLQLLHAHGLAGGGSRCARVGAYGRVWLHAVAFVIWHMSHHVWYVVCLTQQAAGDALMSQLQLNARGHVAYILWDEHAWVEVHARMGPVIGPSW